MTRPNDTKTGLTWWMRIVGGFFLILGVFNTPWVLAARFPVQYPDIQAGLGSPAVRALMDTWFLFGIEIGVVGLALLYFSRDAARHLALAWTVIALEVTRGIGHDLYVIARGADPVFYGGFIVVHLVIIATGVRAIVHARAARAAEATT